MFFAGVDGMRYKNSCLVIKITHAVSILKVRNMFECHRNYKDKKKKQRFLEIMA